MTSHDKAFETLLELGNSTERLTRNELIDRALRTTLALTDAEAWVEIEYMGTSGFPLSLFSNDRMTNIIATPANQSSSSETWTTTGLTTPVKQVMSKANTPAEVGWYRCRLMLAKASTTVYCCPKVKSDSAAQYMTPSGDIINAPAAGGGSGMIFPRPMSGGLT